ncbi:MAG: tetratricopeptide repeat protein [Bacteroidota bacterium]
MIQPKKYHPKKVLMVFMGAFFVMVIGFVYLQTEKSEKSEDPRIKTARELYNSYNTFVSENDTYEVLSLIDSIEHIFLSIPHYRESFEMGVLYNNRSAIYISMYLEQIKNTNEPDVQMPLDSLLIVAEVYANKSIESYKHWMARFEDKTESEIRKLIQSDFFTGLDKYTYKEQQIFLKKRVQTVQKAMQEFPRRLSIVYTNLGIINRHCERYSQAVELYTKALELWGNNLTAENNRNILLGEPVKKHRVIDKFIQD